MANDVVRWVSESREDGREDDVILLQSEGEASPIGTESGLLRRRLCPTAYLVAVVGFSTIGGFLFGYDTSVISGAILSLDADFNYELTALQKELIVSITIAAAAIGALAGGLTNEYLGRKITIIISSVIFSLGAILMAAAPLEDNGWLVILAGRFVVGIGIGNTPLKGDIYEGNMTLIWLEWAGKCSQNAIWDDTTVKNQTFFMFR